jgi:hypothetical protein
MAADFVYYDVNRVLIPHAQLLLPQTVRVVAMELSVRFRYDKSRDNHTWRKFSRLSGNFFCPVKRSQAILRRAHRLRVPLGYPLGVFRVTAAGGFRYISGDRMTAFLRRICLLAYPNPGHYMRLHIDCLVSHSLRVTACVALAAAGLSHEEIAFRLRWSVESVRFYLRDSVADVGLFTFAAVRGAQLIT